MSVLKPNANWFGEVKVSGALKVVPSALGLTIVIPQPITALPVQEPATMKLLNVIEELPGGSKMLAPEKVVSKLMVAADAVAASSPPKIKLRMSFFMYFPP
ncbi:MAG: hypothetical protein WDO18_03925 [Acidobacteriota bacterium]